MSNSRKSFLGGLGRRLFVSQRALAAVLEELNNNGSIPTEHSRSTIKRARVLKLPKETPYGPMMNTIDLTLEKPRATVKLWYINPMGFLSYASSNCQAFSTLLAQKLREHPNSVATPWRIILYSDEVVPGNPLKSDHQQKIQAIYWSFMEFDRELLSCEHLWFVLTCARSVTVQRMYGGMSTLFRTLLCDFFGEGFNFQWTGVIVHANGTCHTLFATVGFMVSDCDALKQAVGCKGASGSLICAICSNCLDHKADIYSHDPSRRLIASTCTDIRRFAQHTDASLRSYIDDLTANSTVAPPGEFKKMQHFFGYNHIDNGLLQCPQLLAIILPITMLMYDWMHIYVSSGIFQLEVNLLLVVLKRVRVTHTQIHNFLSTFTWPARIRGVSGQNAFRKLEKKKEANKTSDDSSKKTFTCSASEALSVYAVIRMYLMMYVLPEDDPIVNAACHSFFALCGVLDLLAKNLKGTPKSQRALHTAIKAHLDMFLSVYEEASWIPKCHYALHLPKFLLRFGFLLCCFVHERRHKELKRYANEFDTNSGYEKAILEDVLYNEFVSLNETETFSLEAPKLVKPHPAPSSMADAIRETLGVASGTAINTAIVAMHAPMQRSSRGDVALIVDDAGARSMAKIIFHAECLGEHFTCVSVWRALGNNQFAVTTENTEIISTTDIVDTCVYALCGESNALVVPPLRA